VTQLAPHVVAKAGAISARRVIALKSGVEDRYGAAGDIKAAAESIAAVGAIAADATPRGVVLELTAKYREDIGIGDAAARTLMVKTGAVPLACN
jgi:hypothetical protein